MLAHSPKILTGEEKATMHSVFGLLAGKVHVIPLGGDLVSSAVTAVLQVSSVWVLAGEL